MNTLLDLARHDYLIAAKHLKENNSADFTKGFDAGANWLRSYITLELLTCQKSQSANSEEE